MANNKLILRSTTSPYTYPYPDIVKGGVLSWDDVDNNFIFLKGMSIKNGSYTSGNATITLNTIDGSSIIITGVTGGSGSTINTYTSGGTYSGGTIVFTNTTGGTYSVTGITSGGSGSTSPAGSSSEIQFNNAGLFGSDSGFTRGISGESFFAISEIGVDKLFAQGSGDWNTYGVPLSGSGLIYVAGDITSVLMVGDATDGGLGVGLAVLNQDDASGDTTLVAISYDYIQMQKQSATVGAGLFIDSDTAGFGYGVSAISGYVQASSGLTEAVFEDGNLKSELILESTGSIIQYTTTGGTNNIIVSSTGVSMNGIPSYDDDTAAGVGGLVTGDMYQTTGSGAAPLNAAGILMIKQ